MPSDAIAVTNLLYRYGELMDLGDFDGVADLLGEIVITVDGVPGEQRGRPSILAMYEGWTRRYDDGTPRTRHLISNPIVEVDADAGIATIRSSYTVFQQVEGLPLQPIIVGRYHDTFQRVDGEWRFARRHLFTDLVGDLSRHLLHHLD
jgi:ketosteroid isomerase-like protein